MWRDNMQQASFRDVPFIVQEHDGQGGRRVGSHEFAGRDVPFTEDMGRKQRKYTLQALVIVRCLTGSLGSAQWC